jgi:hypothetical protein
MSYASTILKIAIHPDTENPIFGECSTHVSVEDDAGGAFIVLEQSNDEAKVGTVRLDPDELDLIVSASKQLLTQRGVKNIL